MLNFSPDQWIIVLLVFVLGLLVGGFLFSGGGRKWKHRYNAEVTRRTDLERAHAEREKEWRERDSLRGAATKGDRDRDGVIDERDRDIEREAIRDQRDRDRLIDERDRDAAMDRDRDGVRDDRDPIDDRRR